MTTIYDIAKHVGVSPATVSNAFNRPEQMKPETRERILAAAKQLDYRPNVSAQALARGKSSLVGLLIPDIRIPYAANVTRGIEDKLVEHGLLPVISSTDGDTDITIERINRLSGNGVSGFILVPAFYGVADSVIDRLIQLQQHGVCGIIAGHEVDNAEINCVSILGQQAAKAATRHLIDLGHRDIGFIGAAFTKGLAVKRWLGFQEAMFQAGIPIRPDLVAEVDSTPAEGYAATEKMMANGQPPTALVAMNDIFARGIIDYVARNKMAVPDTLSFTSFDYLALAQRTTPAITSIVVSAYEIGRKSAERFIELQASPNSTPRLDVIPFELVVRDTTAPPKQKA